MTVTTAHVTSTATSTTNATTVGARVGWWSTPMPYLFGAIALMLALISIALLVLACTEKRRSHHGPKEKAAGEVEAVVDEGPKVVVIMAGDENPTFLAKPVSLLPPTEASSRVLGGDEHV